MERERGVGNVICFLIDQFDLFSLLLFTVIFFIDECNSSYCIESWGVVVRVVLSS